MFDGLLMLHSELDIAATQNLKTALKLGHVFNLIHDILGRATYTDFIYDNCSRLVNEILRSINILSVSVAAGETTLFRDKPAILQA